jgi:hypothetical protein
MAGNAGDTNALSLLKSASFFTGFKLSLLQLQNQKKKGTVRTDRTLPLLPFIIINHKDESAS